MLQLEKFNKVQILGPQSPNLFSSLNEQFNKLLCIQRRALGYYIFHFFNFLICNPETIISRLFIKKNRKGVELYFSVSIINMRHLKRECPKVDSKKLFYT